MNLSDELTWRGFVNQTTLKDIHVLDSKTFTFYWGVDPSADSMTIGNLATAMMVRHFIDHGHKAILLVGGATGLIGDPDGKSEERTLKTTEEIESNKRNITKQYQRIFADQSFVLVDNYDWFKNFNYLQFLRDIGKHVPLRQMVGRDFVQKRITDDGSGMSYAEFSYSLIQAYDFLHLHQTKGVNLQVCGADQWGNCIAGVDLIRRITGDETHVWTAPLIVNSQTGIKFGKSENGAIWLDANKTSIFTFYQFWLNADDEGVDTYLKTYTLLSKEQTDEIMSKFQENKAGRNAQKALAYEVTRLIHGEENAKKQERIARAITGESHVSELDESELALLKAEIPHAILTTESEKNVLAALLKTGLVQSSSEARRLLKDGAIYIDNRKVLETDITSVKGNLVLIRRGKAYKDSALVEL